MASIDLPTFLGRITHTDNHTTRIVGDELNNSAFSNTGHARVATAANHGTVAANGTWTPGTSSRSTNNIDTLQARLEAANARVEQYPNDVDFKKAAETAKRNLTNEAEKMFKDAAKGADHHIAATDLAKADVKRITAQIDAAEKTQRAALKTQHAAIDITATPLAELNAQGKVVGFHPAGAAAPRGSTLVTATEGHKDLFLNQGLDNLSANAQNSRETLNTQLDKFISDQHQSVANLKEKAAEISGLTGVPHEAHFDKKAIQVAADAGKDAEKAGGNMFSKGWQVFRSEKTPFSHKAVTTVGALAVAKGLYDAVGPAPVGDDGKQGEKNWAIPAIEIAAGGAAIALALKGHMNVAGLAKG